jgi:hypothetical protein
MRKLVLILSAPCTRRKPRATLFPMAHTEERAKKPVDFFAGLAATLSAIGLEPYFMTSALQRKGS